MNRIKLSPLDQVDGSNAHPGMNSTGADHLEAERAVVGAVLLEPDLLDDLTMIEPRDFASDRNRMIFEVARWLYDQGRPVDLVTVTEHFQRHNRIDDMGGVSYLSQLCGAVSTTASHVVKDESSAPIQENGGADGRDY